jgi:hypothetical protein
MMLRSTSLAPLAIVEGARVQEGVLPPAASDRIGVRVGEQSIGAL